MYDDPFKGVLSDVTTGERLLWSGRPQPGFSLTLQDGCMLPFALMWTAFSLFWEFMAWRGGAPVFFLLFGLPFVLIGIYLLFGRFLIADLVRRRTHYALTDRRVIIISGLRGRHINSLPLDALGQIGLKEGREGSGTISFVATNASQWWANNAARAGLPGMPAFERIPDARRVYDLVMEARAKAGA